MVADRALVAHDAVPAAGRPQLGGRDGRGLRSPDARAAASASCAWALRSIAGGFQFPTTSSVESISSGTISPAT